MDNVIATIEIPEGVIKQWWDHPPFQPFLEEFTAQNPTAKTLKLLNKGKVSSAAASAVASTAPGNPPKRVRAEDLSRFVVSDDPGKTVVVEVPLVNVRLGSGCTGLPVLVVSDVGPYIKNCSGKTVPQQNI